MQWSAHILHNGIEYGLMEAYAEGFEIMKAKEAFDLDLHQISEIWRFGSVVRSWLLDLTANALADGLLVVDVSDPESPVQTGSSGRDVGDVFVHDRIAYLSIMQ